MNKRLYKIMHNVSASTQYPVYETKSSRENAMNMDNII